MDIRKFVNEKCNKNELNFIRWYLKDLHEKGYKFDDAIEMAVHAVILKRAINCIAYAELKTPREVVESMGIFRK